MAIINPWVQVWERPSASSEITSIQFDWQPNREYMFHVLEEDNNNEIGHSYIKIPVDMDIQPPSTTTGINGFRGPGLDHIIRASVAYNGYKKFDFLSKRETPYFLKVWERELSPDVNNWTLNPSDDTYEFELWYTSQGRTLTISDFQQDYEYLFVVYNPQSSTEIYYSCISFYNFATAYSFASKLHSRMVHYQGYRGWDDWFRMSGFGTTFTTTFKGPSSHKMYRIYRRKMVYDTSLGYYNTFSRVATWPNELKSRTNISKAKLPSNTEVITVINDTPGDNELCIQGQMYLDDTLIPYAQGAGATAGFAVLGGTDNFPEIGGTVSSSYRWVEVDSGNMLELYKREPILEYVEPVDPEPELPDPPEPDTLIPCEDRCVNVGDTYESVGKVEVNFIDPPDWQQRNYSYSWSVIGSNEVTVVGTEAGGRIGLFRLRRAARVEDDRALLPYNIAVTVEDLDYDTAGVTDSDTAVLTFEMPCVTVGNEPEFTITDVDVDECGAGDTDTTATFTVTSSEAVIGNDITIDWATQDITATDGSDYVGSSGTLTFADGETTKTIQITVSCDDVMEDDETFKVVLSNPTRGTFTKSEGIGTILDSTPNVTVVELANAGTNYDIFIARDISGSMGGTQVYINGVEGTRDDLVRQVLNDYTINPVEPGLTAIVGGGVSALHRWIANVIIETANADTNMTHINALFITDSQDRYTASAIKDTYTSPADDHPIWSDADDEPNSTTIAAMPQIDETQNNWTNIGPWPAHVQEFNLTIVRVLNAGSLSTAATTETEQIYNDLFNAADRPALVTTAQLSTFTEYTTGADSEINRQIEASVLATYNAYCSKDPGNTVTVQAADEAEAYTKAQPLLNCPDD